MLLTTSQQSRADAMADAETLRLNAAAWLSACASPDTYPLARAAVSLSHPGYASWAARYDPAERYTAYEARNDARAAFRAVPALRGDR